MSVSVLLADDEETLRETMGMYLSEHDYEVHTASTAEEALDKLDRFLPDVALIDLKMPEKDGFHIIREARKNHSPTVFIVISGYGDIEKAVRATKLGAQYFLEKPFSPDELEKAIQRAVEKASWREHLRHVDEDGVWMATSDWGLVGVSDALRDIYRKVLMVSKNDSATVLIQGESGTGKELVARAIYENTPEPRGKFVDVNCAALSETLLEAELFGHEKGAFTGAAQARQGLFEVADGGVIFLDEIGDMPLKLQSKLLRVLEEKSFKRVGGVENIEVDFRIIASTNRKLRQMVDDGEFRRDLFYRLNVFAVVIPPLRDRPEDLPVLSSYMLAQFSKLYDKRYTCFGQEAMQLLMGHDWPGNVRELRNVIERAVIVGSGAEVKAEDLELPEGAKEAMPGGSDAAPREAQSLECMEKELILRVLEENDWQKAKSAEVLGINRTTLWHKIKRYGLAAGQDDEEPEEQ